MSLKALGNEAFARGEYTKAAKIYRDAISEDPRNAVLYSNRAQAFLKLADYDRALKDTIAGLQLTDDPKMSAKLHYRKGMALKHLGDIHSARECFLQVLQLDPNNAPAQTELAQLPKKPKLDKSVNETANKSESKEIPILTVDRLSSRFTSAMNTTPAKPTHRKEEAKNPLPQPPTEEPSAENFAQRPSMHHLALLKSLPDSKKAAAYKYVLSIDPSVYSDLFSASGVDPQFLEFFLDALIHESANDPNILHKAIVPLETLAKSKRYHLALDFCEPASVKEVLARVPDNLAERYRKVLSDES